jgi:hypothetical protein
MKENPMDVLRTSSIWPCLSLYHTFQHAILSYSGAHKITILGTCKIYGND